MFISVTPVKKVGGCQILDAGLKLLPFFIFYFLDGKRPKKKKKKKTTVLISKEEFSKMLLNTEEKAAYLETKCAQKLAHLETVEAVQTLKRWSCWPQSTNTGALGQSEKR
jgi:hypothetical protein